MLRRQGDDAAAETSLNDALTLFHDTGYSRGAIGVTANLGELRLDQGDLRGALRLFDEAVKEGRPIGDRQMLSSMLAALAEAEGEAGALEDSARSYDEALGIDRAIGYQSGLAAALAGDAEIRLLRGNIAGARDAAKEALAICTKIGEKPGAASSRGALAEIALAEGDPKGADSLANAALAGLAPSADTVRLEILEARALTALGHHDEAIKQLDRASAESTRILDPLVRWDLALARARATDAGGAKAAAHEAARVASEAASKGYLGEALEARLAQGQLELRGGDVSTGKADLRRLATDADGAGFRLYAEQAKQPLGH